MTLTTAERKISEELQAIADGLSDRLQSVAGQKMGFSLIVFNTIPGSRMNYISNCEREDVAAALKSLLIGWEKGMPDIKAHEFQ